MGLNELRAQVEASRAALDEKRRSARHAQVDEADAAAAHVALENALEREEWIEAQRSLGVPDENIDADLRVVTVAPLGPVHVVTDQGIVTLHPESDEADLTRTSPDRGLELSTGRALNRQSDEPFQLAHVSRALGGSQ